MVKVEEQLGTDCEQREFRGRGMDILENNPGHNIVGHGSKNDEQIMSAIKAGGRRTRSNGDIDSVVESLDVY